MDASKERIIKSVESLGTQPDVVDLRKEPELPAGVESWIERVEKVQPQKVVDDSTGQVVMTATTPTDPLTSLPTTKQSFAAGFKQTINDAGKWLSTFIFRVIKIKKGKVKFKGE